MGAVSSSSTTGGCSRNIISHEHRGPIGSVEAKAASKAGAKDGPATNVEGRSWDKNGTFAKQTVVKGEARVRPGGGPSPDPLQQYAASSGGNTIVFPADRVMPADSNAGGAADDAPVMNSMTTFDGNDPGMLAAAKAKAAYCDSTGAAVALMQGIADKPPKAPSSFPAAVV